MKENNQQVLVIYKLSGELFVFTFFLCLFYCVAEIILPGIFSQRVSLLPLFIAITGSSLLFIFIGHYVGKEKNNIPLQMSTKQGVFFSFFFSFFVLSDLGKLGWGMYIFLFFLVFISFYSFLLLIFSKEKEDV
jgi:hypothetical protein